MKFPFREGSRGKKKKNYCRENNGNLKRAPFNKLAGAFQITLIVKELLLGQMAAGVQSVFLVELGKQNGRTWDFPGDSVVKNMPANAGTQVRALVREDPTCCGATKPVRHNY